MSQENENTRGGWIKVHRALLDKPIWANSTLEQRVILITLLCMASHEPKKWEWNGKPYEIKPGQFITSLASIIKRCNCKDITVKKVRNALTRFENLGFLTSKATNKNRLVTIVNWGKYQDYSDTEGKQKGNQEASKGQAEGKRGATIKKEKEYKNYKKDKERGESITDPYSFSEPKETQLEAIITKWNTLKENGINQISGIEPNSRRYKQTISLLKKYGINRILENIDKVKNSNFLCGDNDRGWTISFDWFIEADKFLKVLEDNYKNNPQKNRSKNTFNNFEGRDYNVDELMDLAISELSEEIDISEL